MTEEWRESFREKFFQNTDGEKVEGWLAMRTHFPDKGFSKVAIPSDLESFISQQRKEAAREALEALRKDCVPEYSRVAYSNEDAADGYEMMSLDVLINKHIEEL